MPAIVGPMMRDALNIAEFNAIAFGRSADASTISTTKAWRAGVSKEFTSPWKICSSTISVTVIRPLIASPARAADCSADNTCVMRRIRRRSQRSPITPPNGARIRSGICPANATTPSRNSEPVSRNTSQLVATRVIHVPTSESDCPPKNSR